MYLVMESLVSLEFLDEVLAERVSTLLLAVNYLKAVFKLKVGRI